MRIDGIGPGVIREQLQRIRAAFPGTKVLDVTFFADELLKATRRGHWTTEEFIAACDTVIQEEEFFPKIRTILKHRPDRPRQEKREEESTGSRCRRCGVEPYGAGYENGFLGLTVRTRCGCDPGLAGFETPAAKEYTEQLRERGIERGSSRVA